MVHKLNAGDVRAAADAFLMWERPMELKGRREGERAQFLTADAMATVSKMETVQLVGNPDRVAAAPAMFISAPTIVGPKMNMAPPCARALCPLRKVA